MDTITKNNPESSAESRNKISRIKEESLAFNRQVREKSAGFIISALGFVAGLAWNDAIKSSIELIFPIGNGNNGIWAKLSYAVIVTVVITGISVYLLRPPKSPQ